MNKFILATVVLAIAIFFFASRYAAQYQVATKGTVVKMLLTDRPTFCEGGKSLQSQAAFQYNGMTYKKNVSRFFCSKHFVGEYMDMRYLRGHELVLYPDEVMGSSFYLIGSILLLMIIGVVMVFRSGKLR
ncbi:hypothetical protein [Chitinophaga agri]|uniref:DUF3592 domain-containing protein n=1 Tax=Chitinophaga agri TaxID=2703787 RepID=A0A6B9ZQP1_9BACT|nr:hypothetical protein [Chitinophaga agri]QHS63443.1 hypothetical protein GWR21_28810 [Chitinophaga agri]